MTAGPLRLSRKAEEEVEAMVIHCLRHYGRATALRLLKTLRRAVNALAFMSGLGAPCRGDAVGFNGLRMWPLRRYPHLIFYLDRPDTVQFLRLLHERQNLRGPQALLDRCTPLHDR